MDVVIDQYSVQVDMTVIVRLTVIQMKKETLQEQSEDDVSEAEVTQ
jgi:hypothetical protein